MLSAQEALALDHLYVVCHGDGPVQPLSEGISAVPLQAHEPHGTHSPRLPCQRLG